MHKNELSIPVLRRLWFAAALSLSFLAGGFLATAVASDIYVAQNAAGADTGTDAADAHSLAWLNAASNWKAGAGTINPGDTVHLVGTITSGVGIRASGSPGAPITILFESDANMTAPIWGDAALNYSAIYLGGCSYITIDGGNNGAIQATQCGDGLAHDTACNGVTGTTGSGINIQNLAISGLFLRTRWSTNTVGGGTGVGFSPASSGGILVSNCSIHDCAIGVGFSFGAGVTNVTVANNTIYNINWGVLAGDSGPTAVLNGLTVSGNKIHDWAVWDDPIDAYHHNGIFCYGNNGCITNLAVYGNVIGPGFGRNNTSGIYINSYIYNTVIYNNIITGSDGTSPANGFITLGINGGGASSSVGIYNNSFIGADSGVAVQISRSSGTGPMPVYSLTNNLFYRVGTAIANYYYKNFTIYSDYNLFFGIPSRSIICVSPDGNSAYEPLSTWQHWQADVHASTQSPNVDDWFVPRRPSAAIVGGFDLSAIFTTDIYGNLRTNGFDIGACQHYRTNPPLRPPINLRVVLPPGPMMTTNLVAWWPLDDLSGLDASGNGNAGALVKSPATVPGQVTNALSFGGSGQYVDCGNKSSLNAGTSSFTLSLWASFKDESEQNYPSLAGKFAGGSSAGYGILVNPGNIVYGSINDGSGEVDAMPLTASNDGNWHFFALVIDRDAKVETLYKDAAPVASVGIGSVGNLNNSTHFQIANRAQTFFNGSADDVRLYNRALSGTEIGSIYSNGQAGCP